MKIGVVGLGKMGSNLVKNMTNNNLEVIGFDINCSSKLYEEISGFKRIDSLDELVTNLSSPRVIWLMVPAGKPTDETIDRLISLMEEGDILIDGGNSFYKDSIRNYQKSKERGVHFFDCGTSGGIDGALNGANLMIGGDEKEFSFIQPIFERISAKGGYLYTGEAGSGHYLKMIHNGIEYGMMQAIGEGFEILQKSQFSYNNQDVARLWNNGSVIRSWLMELMEDSFKQHPQLKNVSGKIESSGEGKWTVEEALELKVSIPVISASLFARYRSHEEETFSGKVVSSLRNGFGGHDVQADE